MDVKLHENIMKELNIVLYKTFNSENDKSKQIRNKVSVSNIKYNCL